MDLSRLLVRNIVAGDLGAVRQTIASAPDPMELVNTIVDTVPPLWYALGGRVPNLEIVRVLLVAGADPVWTYPHINPQWDELPLDRQVHWNNFKGNKDIYQEGPTGPEVQVGHLAVSNGNPEIIELMEAHGMDIVAATLGTGGPLFTALLGFANQVEVVRWLIARDIHRDGGGDLPDIADLFGRYYNHSDVMEELLRAGYTIDSLLWPLLFAAVSSDNIQDVHSVLACGITLNVRDRQGRSPLGFALSQGSLNAAKALISAGAELSAAEADNRRFGVDLETLLSDPPGS